MQSVIKIYNEVTGYCNKELLEKSADLDKNNLSSMKIASFYNYL